MRCWRRYPYAFARNGHRDRPPYETFRALQALAMYRREQWRAFDRRSTAATKSPVQEGHLATPVLERRSSPLPGSAADPLPPSAQLVVTLCGSRAMCRLAPARARAPPAVPGAGPFVLRAPAPRGCRKPRVSRRSARSAVHASVPYRPASRPPSRPPTFDTMSSACSCPIPTAVRAWKTVNRASVASC